MTQPLKELLIRGVCFVTFLAKGSLAGGLLLTMATLSFQNRAMASLWLFAAFGIELALTLGALGFVVFSGWQARVIQALDGLEWSVGAWRLLIATGTTAVFFAVLSTFGLACQSNLICIAHFVATGLAGFSAMNAIAFFFTWLFSRAAESGDTTPPTSRRTP